MNRKKLFVSFIVLIITMFAMISCSSSEFSVVTETEKEVNITAEKADEDSTALSGSIVVGEDEQITIEPSLTEGALKIEFISAENGEDIDDLEDVEGMTATYTANVTGTESQSVSFGGGSYVVRVSPTEKATGTVHILVK